MKRPIPEAAFQQHVAVLGKTGSGKTFAAKGRVEEWLRAHRRVCVVDPTGAWWGLRSSSDGRGPGLPILVLGGDHGDLPLPALGGGAVARLVAEQNVNLVADTSQLTVGERTRWFVDFATTLYRANRAPLQLVIDEAHNFAPQGGGQVRDPDVGKMLHAANTLASGGRSRGIRLMLITQRPQKLHKDALTSADTLIALRLLAPHDRDAVRDWIRGAGDDAQGKVVLDTLAGLPRGEGWVWYPEGAYLERVVFPSITTFDSSATPTDGAQVTVPRRAADVDLTEIRAALADAVQEAEANDPKLLRAEISRLRSELHEKAPAAAAAEPDPEALAAEYSRGLRRGVAEAWTAEWPTLLALRDRLAEAIVAIDAFGQKVADSAEAGQEAPQRAPAPVEAIPRPAAPRALSDRQRGRIAAAEALGVGERAILTAIAQHGTRGATREQLSILTGYKRSTRDTYIQRLAGRALIAVDPVGDGCIIALQSGVEALGKDFERLPTGAKLRQHWLGKLPEGERRIFEVVVQAYPRAVERDALSVATDYKRSTRDTYLQRLAARRLVIAAERGAVRAAEELFR